MTPDALPTPRVPARSRSPWRVVGWSLAALVVVLPSVLSLLTDEVNWSLGDVVVAAVLVLGVGVPLEVTARRRVDAAYRWAVGIALGAAFLLVWLSLGVGIIGADGDPANVLYGGVIAVGIVGAGVARGQPRGMGRALVATALAQGAVAAGALVAGLGAPYSGPLETVALNGVFVALWVASAVLFRRSARSAALGAPRAD